MKKALLLTIVLLVWAGEVKAQQENIDDGFGLGIQLNQYQRDFGAGINVSSPYFANGKVAVRLRGNLMFNEHVLDGETTWTPYANASFGLIGGSGIVNNFARFYGEGGFIGLFPSDDFSTDDFVFGGYGLFGFEFFLNDTNTFFIEIGGVGTGARANRIITDPVYSNGLLIATGFRVHL